MPQKAGIGLEDQLAHAQRELDELRRQRAATAAMLQVMSRSTFDLQNVLNTLVESAAGLCGADMAAIIRPKGEALLYAASYGFSQDFDEFAKKNPISAGRGTLVGRTLLEGKPVHIPDVEVDPEYTWTQGAEDGWVSHHARRPTHSGWDANWCDRLDALDGPPLQLQPCSTGDYLR